MKKTLLFFVLIAINMGIKGQVSINADIAAKGTPMSQTLIGAFFEDINYGADGGLYAELVQNRSFEYKVTANTTGGPLSHWDLLLDGGANASYAIENANPLNANNTNYLKLNISNAGSEVSLKNNGFFGMAVKAGEKYKFSVYMRSQYTYSNPIRIHLKNAAGAIIGGDTIAGATTTWTKYTLEFTCTQTDNAASLYISTTGIGTLFFDMISLFPQDTYKGRENGLRKDLAQAVADLNPRFLRFPGGCISHGRGLDNAYRWKETVGDVAQRIPNWNTWGYHQTYGLGFYEYFVFSEDIGAIPLPVIPIGISCQFRTREVAPIADMGPWIQDAIDLIEFANGGTTTKWGGLRAQMGHPEPFNMEYICLGNEEDDIPEFRERFLMFKDTIQKYHPEIKIIGTSGVDDTGGYYTSLWQFSKEQKLDAVDEHYYNDPSWFINNNHRYDNFDRNGPKVFIGEYASLDDLLGNAIAEAAYLTGVERNSDIIQFACYAPLFAYEENISYRWNPDLIRFNNTQLVKTASYYVQQMYGQNAGDEFVANEVVFDKSYTGTPNFKGNAGVGTWNTQASFDDFKVVSGSKVWANDDFSATAANWQVNAGTFGVASGTYKQTASNAPAWSINKTVIDTTAYTITLKAMKTGGAEGFLIPFAYTDDKNYYWLNLGGWGNTQHAVEKCTNGAKSAMVTVPGSLTNSIWYTIKIDVTKTGATLYLNDQLLFSIPAPASPVTASVSKDIDNNQLIVKVVNSGNSAINAAINIQGAALGQSIAVTTLTGTAGTRNSLASPNLIVPTEKTITVADLANYTLPANSFQVMRIGFTATPVKKPIAKPNAKNKKALTIVPNPTNNETVISYNNPQNEACSVVVYNMKGDVVYNVDGTNRTNVIFNKGNLPNGTYLVKLICENSTSSAKMVLMN